MWIVQGVYEYFGWSKFLSGVFRKQTLRNSMNTDEKKADWQMPLMKDTARNIRLRQTKKSSRKSQRDFRSKTRGDTVFLSEAPSSFATDAWWNSDFQNVRPQGKHVEKVWPLVASGLSFHGDLKTHRLGQPKYCWHARNKFRFRNHYMK